MNTTKEQISDKTLETFLPNYDTMIKIGSKKKAIETLRSLGYDSLEDFQAMVESVGGVIMHKIGNTYYWC